jgi:hypothetical protein
VYLPIFLPKVKKKAMLHWEGQSCEANGEILQCFSFDASHLHSFNLYICLKYPSSLASLFCTPTLFLSGQFSNLPNFWPGIHSFCFSSISVGQSTDLNVFRVSVLQSSCPGPLFHWQHPLPFSWTDPPFRPVLTGCQIYPRLTTPAGTTKKVIPGKLGRSCRETVSRKALIQNRLHDFCSSALPPPSPLTG